MVWESEESSDGRVGAPPVKLRPCVLLLSCTLARPRSPAWLAALVLAIGSVAAWPDLVAAPRSRVIELLVLVACASAGALTLAHARVVSELAVAIAIAAGAVALFVGLARIRAASRGPFS